MRRTNPKDREHVPMRTCVGCRQRAAKGELLRVIAPEVEPSEAEVTRVVIDRRQKLPGRGAYIHPKDACVVAATQRGGLARSFRRRLVAPTVEQFLRSEDKGQS